MAETLIHRIADAATPREEHALAVLEDAFARFDRIAISFSGAEDVVLIDLAARLVEDVPVFCLDTGRLHAETYRFLETVREHYPVKLEVLSPDAGDLARLVREKGLFSFFRDGHGECCAIRKIEPLRRRLAGLDAWITGQRADQSVTRADLPVEQDDLAFSTSDHGIVKFNPLSAWTGAKTFGTTSAVGTSRTTRSTTKVSARSVASLARARSVPTSTSAKGAGGGKTPTTRNAASTRRTSPRSGSSTGSVPPPVHITFVKKILANGEPCAKCADVQQRLESSGQIDSIHRVVIADERDPHSEGMRLAAAHGVEVAPFFILEDGDRTTVYTVYLRFAREVLGGKSQRVEEAQEVLRANPDLDFL